jgi:spore germination protein GerM
MNKEVLIWITPLWDKESNNLLIEAVNELLEVPMVKSMNEYKQEKLIKSFTEGIRYLESLMKYEYGINHSRVSEMVSSGNFDEKKYISDTKMIGNIIKTEIKRQLRHFKTFLI